jgi:D-lactate dehydrogenase (cytochrome)
MSTHTSSLPEQQLREAFAALSEQLGDRATTGQTQREHHASGESHHPPALPDIVCFPHSTEEVSEILKISARYQLPVIPFGAGTSVEGQVNALHGGISIDLREMSKILRTSVEDLDVTVQAGVTRLQLCRSLRGTGTTFFIDPGADATIGGMAATRASGTTAVRYGTMRENVLGLTVVLADGRIIHTGSRARKSSAGYDLTHLFVGSEGTLGVITEIVLRLHILPEAVSAATCCFPTIDAAVQTAIEVIQRGISVARIELLDEKQLDAINRFSGTELPEMPTLFFEFHGMNERDISDQSEVVQAIAEENSGLGFQWKKTLEEREALWKARHDAYYASLQLRPGSRVWTTDACVPISRLAKCINETKRDLASVSFPATVVGHVGDGNFHVLCVLNPENPAEYLEAEALSERIVQRAQAADGTCTGEHGIGYGKLKHLQAEHWASLDVLRSIKQALDPENRMNPGKMVVSN